jgi:hypothetical protein
MQEMEFGFDPNMDRSDVGRVPHSLSGRPTWDTFARARLGLLYPGTEISATQTAYSRYSPRGERDL